MKNFSKLKLSNLIVTLFFSISPFFCFSQFSKPDEKFPVDEKYIYPVHPGQPGSLAGTMGELRSTHFHSGIDIRTNNEIGYPVVASKSGYISRVTVSPSGYGNIIYVKHPDGNTTLYAHLDKFVGPVAEHILREQYSIKSFSVDLEFEEGKFPVKQGELIALSGNTGSSSGPHVHFDIRDKDNYALDPLKVANFPEVIDNLPPAAEKIALKTMDINSRINDRYGRFEFHAAKAGINYTIASPILASGVIGLELIAKDRLAPGSPFYGGVNYIEVHVDSQLVFSQAIEKVDISETRGIYTLMDFKTLRNKGTRFYKLYIDDGNRLKFYERSPGTGKIRVPQNKESLVTITMRDSYGNKSNIYFRFKPSPQISDVKSLEPMTSDLFYDISENTMMVTAKPCADSTSSLRLYEKGKEIPLEPTYRNANRSVYLVDLRGSLPDSIASCTKTLVTNLKQLIPSGTEYKYYGNETEITFPSDALYDSMFLTTKYSKLTDGTEVFLVGDRTVPLNKPIKISLIPQTSYTQNAATGVYRLAGKGYSFVSAGEWLNGRINFTTREFGEFTVLQDVAPPTIKVINADRTGARFKIRDNLSGIATYEAYINGDWLLMKYDAKTATIWSEKLDKSKALSGDFELIVTDNAGNKSTFTRRIP